MSSECWLGACSEGQAEEKQQEEAAEKKEVEFPFEDNQQVGSQRQEQVPGGRLSPDPSGMQEVTSEGGLEQVRWQETQTGEEEEMVNQGRCDEEPGV